MTKFAMLKILLILSLLVLLARTTPLIETKDAFGDGGAIGTKRIAGGVPAERGLRVFPVRHGRLRNRGT